MNPYLEASEEQQRQDREPEKYLKRAGSALAGAGGTALGIVGGGKILSRLAPLLSTKIPIDLAIKGLNKIDPRIGKFVSDAIKTGNTEEEALDFLREKVSGKEVKEEFAKQNGNVIEQYDPELFTYIKEKVSKGIPVLQAGEKAKDHPRFLNAIKKLEKDHKTPWSNILQSVFGGQGEAQPQEQEQSQQPQQQQSGNALQALTQSVDQARQILEKYRGKG
jgi:hypothetical protein